MSSFDNNYTVVEEKVESGPIYILTEIISKLIFSKNHLDFLKHECSNCIGVDNLEWCVSNMKHIRFQDAVKILQYENEENDLEQRLLRDENVDKDLKEVCLHILQKFRLKKPHNIETETSQRYANRRRSLRIQEYFNELDDEEIRNLLAIRSKPRHSQLWMMEMLDNWSCDMFRIAELTIKPLTMITYAILEKRNLIKTLNIPTSKLVSYMHEVEAAYHSDNPYHNHIHAADVLQTMHYLLLSKPLAEAFTDLEILALLIGSAIHDVDHPGFSNMYLIKTKSPIAILYNDVSVLENHHLAVAFKILYAKNCNFLAHLSEKDTKFFRSLVIQLVMATDTNYHMNVTSAFDICIEKCLVGDELILEKVESRMDLMRGLLHFADISSPTKALDLYLNWTERIMKEFFAQGDRELKRKIKVSPLCDRHKTNIPQAQVGFIDYIVRPVCEIVVKVLSSHGGKTDRGKRLHDHLQENYDYFKHKSEANKDDNKEMFNLNDEVLNKGAEDGMFDTKNKITNNDKEIFNKISYFNFPQRRNHIPSLTPPTSSMSIDFQTPYFFHVQSRPCLKWNVSGSDDECDCD